MVERTRRRLWQHLAVLLVLPLAPFWLLFAVVNYPFIVPADSDFGLVALQERAATVGAGMALFSAVSLLWAGGVFGRAAGSWGCASILLGGLALSGFFLYPSAKVLVFSSMALTAHVAGVAVVFMGRAGLTQYDAKPDIAPDSSGV
ncbi:MAG: hypothetical protein C0478_12745 [Planctomyces sp.]|nr:hypothetical protein [Planctomyces sp.]